MKFYNAALALSCLGVPCFAGSAADVKVLAGDPSTVSRTVTYHETDIIPISTEIRFTTLIELPERRVDPRGHVRRQRVLAGELDRQPGLCQAS